MLARLRDQGIRLWLDDFGTGFSGLSHLMRLPVDGVKIDRAFIAGMFSESEHRALTRTIIGMAQSLGIVTVAEGIEQPEQYDALREAGCDFGQGFWLGKPMSQREFREFADERRQAETRGL